MCDEPITESELDQIAARCEATSPGPWKSYIEGRDHESGDNFIMIGEGDTRGDDLYIYQGTHADQDFIANARQDIPRLIAEIRRLRKNSYSNPPQRGGLYRRPLWGRMGGDAAAVWSQRSGALNYLAPGQ